MTDDLIYSMDAVNTLSQFTETDYVVFVEDKDDEFFWKKIFCLFAKEKSFSFRYEDDVRGLQIVDFARPLQVRHCKGDGYGGDVLGLRIFDCA